ncbi:MAG: DNA-formamidopyrimidine glycosylase family protein [Microthrixaceae bacterium]
MTMAELPELEILRRDLDKEVGGKRIKTVEAPSAATIKRGGPKKALVSRLEGCKLESVARRGTWLVLGLDSGEFLMITLGDRASLRRNQNKDETLKGTAVVLTFTQHGQLRLIDPAKSSELFVVADKDAVDEVVGALGLDLVDEPISWTTFGEMVLRRQGNLKSALMDPSMLVGIGTMYSDEILFEAGLRWDRPASGLSTQEIRRLYRAAVEIVHDAVKHGGATAALDGIPTLSGQPGGYSPMINVYQRDGQMSPRARGPIVKAKFGAGFTYFCEQTQI